LISLGSYKVGSILLGGLFFYDIFWVFGTEVMVTVAKNFDAPVKLLFPKDILFNETTGFSMLGLGDIVIPGIFIALMLRYDYTRNKENRKIRAKDIGLGFNFGDDTNFKNKKKERIQLRKPFFKFTFTSYIIGMIVTIGIMHFFRAAQPALLYLVPACIGGSLFCAALLGEVRNLILFEEEEKKPTEDHAKDKGSHKTGNKKHSEKN